MQELEGDEEGEDEDDAETNPKVSVGGRAPAGAVLCVQTAPMRRCGRGALGPPVSPESRAEGS